MTPDPSSPADTDDEPPVPLDKPAKITLILMAAALLLVMWLRLFLVLVVGLSAFALHRGLARSLARHVTPLTARRMALVVLLLALVGCGFAIADLSRHVSILSGEDGLPRFMRFMADSLDRLRNVLPSWVVEHMPETPADVRVVVAGWLREHAAGLQMVGYHTLRGIAYALAGLVVGLLAAMHAPAMPSSARPFAAAWRERLMQLEDAFVRVASAQLRIALLNAVFTGVYLLIVMPLMGYALPFRTTLVLLTFVAGLLPIVGNLLSNTAIVLTSLMVSPWLAVLSLGFLIGIHKFEYFLNAHIVGSRIQVPSYELLAAMLVLDAAFGLPGLVAAPIYYAWITQELRRHGAI